MALRINILVAVIAVIGAVNCQYDYDVVSDLSTDYKPTWKSLDSRPLPSWYDESKIGIFIHWGVFSVPSYGSEWFWWNWKGIHDPSVVTYVNRNFKPNFTYFEFAPKFTAEFYDPDAWANLFKRSGAKYIVLTSKHHEGFTLWPSKVSWAWNAFNVGPKRDLLGDLASAVRKAGLHFGAYHSLFEWFNPLYLYDKNNSFRTSDFVNRKTIPELFELVTTYKPEVIWSDGDWEASSDYWTSKEFLAWLYNESPVKDTVVTNDRWGNDTLCKHGGYLTCSDKFDPGKLMTRKWENAMTLDKGSWGYRRNANIEDYLTVDELIATMAETVSCGGNLLINVGPTHDGSIIPVMQERLLQMGDWLAVNGEAIYATKPWTYQNDTVTPGVWYTQNTYLTVFAIVLKYPINNHLVLGSVTGERYKTKLYLLDDVDNETKLQWDAIPVGGIMVHMPNVTTQRPGWVIRIIEPV